MLLARQRLQLFCSSHLAGSFFLWPPAQTGATCGDATSPQHQPRVILLFSKAYSKARGDRFNPQLCQPDHLSMWKTSLVWEGYEHQVVWIGSFDQCLVTPKTIEAEFIYRYRYIYISCSFFSPWHLEGVFSSFFSKWARVQPVWNSTTDGHLGCDSATGLLSTSPP